MDERYRYLYKEGLKERNDLPYTHIYERVLDSLRISYIYCHNVPLIDKGVLPDMEECYKEEWDLLRKDLPDYIPAFYTWCITDAGEADVQFVNKHFSRFYFVYSDILETFVLGLPYQIYDLDYKLVRSDVEDLSMVPSLIC